MEIGSLSAITLPGKQLRFDEADVNALLFPKATESTESQQVSA